MKDNSLTIEYNDCLGERHRHEYPSDIGTEPVVMIIKNIVDHGETHRMSISDLKFRVVTRVHYMTLITLMFEPNMTLRTFQYHHN